MGKSTEEGSEDRKIITEGVLCSVYSAKIWEDKAALEALMNADNDDADVEMGEDEIQALGRVEPALKQVEDKGGGPVTADAVLEEMRTIGLRAFTAEQTKAFVEFRLALTEGVAKCFRTLVFASVCGRVTVNPLDYKAVATLDVRCMWAKVSILMYLYMSTYYAKWPPGSIMCGGQFTGLTKVIAVRLPAGVLKALLNDYPLLVRMEKYITKVILQYPIENTSGGKVMRARRELFVAMGKLAFRVGSQLDKEVVKAAAMLKPVKPETRAVVIDTATKNQWGIIEGKYRAALVEAKVFDQESLLAPLHCQEKEKKQEKNARDRGGHGPGFGHERRPSPHLGGVGVEAVGRPSSGPGTGALHRFTSSQNECCERRGNARTTTRKRRGEGK